MQSPDAANIRDERRRARMNDYAMVVPRVPRPKKGSLKLLPADGIIVARSPYGGIGTPRFKDNWRKRYARNIDLPIL